VQHLPLHIEDQAKDLHQDLSPLKGKIGYHWMMQSVIISMFSVIAGGGPRSGRQGGLGERGLDGRGVSNVQPQAGVLYANPDAVGG